ncbi:hypothetical protein KAR91_47155 [Candidatus Pacearchaeota archaeon]|nr:hypothetical protein [Candidatus Pacearchaeota archaeon]
MLTSISVVDVLENGVEIPQDHNYENHDWGWKIDKSYLHLWCINSQKVNSKYRIWVSQPNSYRVFDYEEYIVVLEKNRHVSTAIYAVFPEFV